jgi:hypothetical protein
LGSGHHNRAVLEERGDSETMESSNVAEVERGTSPPAVFNSAFFAGLFPTKRVTPNRVRFMDVGVSDSVPMNDLDHAIMALYRSKAATPEFYRQLAQGELWFLLLYHPEIEGEVLELKNGSPIPFALYQEDGKEFVMLFSSEARVEEALRKGNVPSRTFSAGSMPARQVLEVVGKCGLSAIVNRACATGAMFIPPDLMRDLADGSALQPIPETGKREEGTLKILDPADYPTGLVQAVFEFVRHHSNFRAVWVFGTLPPPAEGRSYQLLFFMEPRGEVLFHDLNMIVQAAAGGTEVALGLLSDEDVKGIAGVAPPFYAARDFRPEGEGTS